MQRWEYMTWLVGNGGRGPVRERNGEAVPDWKRGPSLVAALNESGAQGWELFNVQKLAITVEPLYIFRRPVLWDAE